jgi:hypothetical protein
VKEGMKAFENAQEQNKEINPVACYAFSGKLM